MSLPGGKYYLETYGCEMNDYDSALVESLLTEHGMTLSADKASADILLINTCSVRRHAEQRVLSLLSQYRKLKEDNPRMKIVLLGCMGSRLGDELLNRFPHLDLVVGPDGYRKLPDLLNGGDFHRLAWMGDDSSETYDGILPCAGSVTAGVAVARGCDNYCSYCIVPYVRGRERSRPPESIFSEMRRLAESGVREVTLLGQNVNSYRYGDYDFPRLLREAGEVEGIERLRFLTSHPKDLSERLLRAMADCAKIAPHLHLPIQSGSDRILTLMNRNYTGKRFLDLVNKAREIIPDISITTDIIAGFPTETEEDFQRTLELVRQVRFDSAFTYRYSVREGTAAAELPDDVPEDIKIERLERLIVLVRKIAAENLFQLAGKTCAVLIERESRKTAEDWMGRTEHNRIAVLSRENFKPGDFVEARVESINSFTLKITAASIREP